LYSNAKVCCGIFLDDVRPPSAKQRKEAAARAKKEEQLRVSAVLKQAPPPPPSFPAALLGKYHLFRHTTYYIGNSSW
jgi:hypothetical protein